ncbi:MAG: carboxypeptidase regulatory-like domain-containing protein [Planctomycetota bacterium]
MIRMSQLAPAVLSLAIAILASGCGDSSSEPGAGEGKPADGAGQPTGPEVKVDTATAGTISGAVKFEGAAPTERVNSAEADAFCHSKHPEGIKSESAVIGAGGELANVFVWIKKGITGKFPLPSEPAVLTQSGCRYEPHVLGLRNGQDLVVKNDDDTMHNVHSLPKANEEFNFAQTKKGDEARKKFSSQEVMVKFKCDAHGWMSCYVGVVNHPYFAVTAADGKFELKNVPPGEYEVEAWHEKFGKQSLSAKVESKGTATLTFTLKEK